MSNIQLPFAGYAEAFVKMVRAARASILVAQTGAGKSTLAPLALLKAGAAARGRIAVLVPRRVIAMELAQWVASLHGTAVGEVVGYQIGGERMVGENTKLVFMTTRVLLNQMRSDPELRRYSVIILDEAHERSVDQDLALAQLKLLLARRDDVRVCVFSATIDAGAFSQYLGNAPVLNVPGRLFKVDVSYLDASPSGSEKLYEAIASCVETIVARRQDGDILVFLPDEASIKKACELLDKRMLDIRVLPLYGAQSPEEQRQVFERNGKRRVIVATNIAETSLTIEGVRHVIDSGLIKQTQYLSANMSALRVTEHSQAGCNQRTGRAGRTQDGWCYRLFTRDEFNARPAYTQPELLRTALDGVLLDLLVQGYEFDEVLALPLMDPVPSERWEEARERLKKLRAIDENNKVTADGEKMAAIPASPMVGRMLLSADTYGCLSEVVTVAASLGARSVFTRPRGKEEEADKAQAAFKDASSDAMTLLKVWNAWLENGESWAWARERYLSSRALTDIGRNRDLIVEALKRLGMQRSTSEDPERVLKAIASGLVLNMARRTGGHSYILQGEEAWIHPSSSVFDQLPPTFIVCAEVMETTKRYCRGVSAVAPAWLADILPPDMVQVSYEVRPPLFTLDRPLQVVAKYEFEGTRLLETPVEQLTAPAREALVSFVAQTVVEGQWAFRTLPATWLQAFNAYTQLKREFAEDWDTTVAVEAGRRFKAMCEKQFATAETLTQAVEMELPVRVEELIDPVLMAGSQERRRAREAYAAEWERAHQERLAAQRRAHEAARAQVLKTISPLREKFEELLARMGSFTLPVEITNQVASAKYALDYFDDVAMVEFRVQQAVSALEKHLETMTEAIAQTAQVWELTLALAPTCPLCGGSWKDENSRTLVCRGEHDLRRVVWGTGDEQTLAIFNTQRRGNANQAARLIVVGEIVMLMFDHARGQPWAGYTFKGVEQQTRVAILPAHYAGDREFILEVVAEIERLEKATKEALERLRAVSTAAKAGDVRKLTFKVEDGRSVAVDDRRRYVAVFDQLYPGGGETWYCHVSQTPSGNWEAKALYKLETDPESLKRDLREGYPELPAQLLQ